jgi:hypothetical protein
MKNNIKALQLIESGLSSKTVSKLSESQIDELHSKMVSEQPQPQVVSKTVKQIVLPSGSQTTVGGVSVSNTGGKTVVTPTTEGELGEEKTKKGEPNPWAICHSQVGPKKTRKFERCVKAVKKSLKEGKNPVSLFLENEIMRIVEKHIPPRISKGDLLQYLSEDTETAPSKPTTKPTTKPETKPRPKSPGSNPNPGEKEAPRAKKEMGEDTETAPSKPTTKPTTKPTPKPRPKSPGHNPNPGEKEAPRAISPEKAKNEVINSIMKILNNG